MLSDSVYFMSQNSVFSEHREIQRVGTSTVNAGLAYFFASYSSRDLAVATQQLDILQGAGFAFVRSDELDHGSEWHRCVKRAIENSKGVLMFLTPEFFKSPYCIQELELGFSNVKPLVFVHLQQTEIPVWFQLSASSHTTISAQQLTDSDSQGIVISALSDICKKYSA